MNISVRQATFDVDSSDRVRQYALHINLFILIILAYKLECVSFVHSLSGCTPVVWANVGWGFSLIVVAFYLPLSFSARVSEYFLSDKKYPIMEIKNYIDQRIDCLIRVRQMREKDVILETLCEPFDEIIKNTQTAVARMRILIPLARILIALALLLNCILMCSGYYAVLGPFAIWPILLFPFIREYICWKHVITVHVFNKTCCSFFERDKACCEYLSGKPGLLTCDACPYKSSSFR